VNPLDWLLLLLLGYSVVRAAMRGLVVEAFALGGLAVGFLMACWFYLPLATHFGGLVQPPMLTHFAAFLLIVFATMLLAALIGRLVRRTVSAVGLGLVDRLMGALFGLLRGALLAVAVLSAIVAFLPTAPWVTNSLMAPYFLNTAHAVSSVMPQDLSHRLREGVERSKHTAPDWIKPGVSSQTEN
jgi:membrane protein required for colicin V production